MIMCIDNGRALIVIYGILPILATQLTLVAAGSAIQTDANGHVDIPNNRSLQTRRRVIVW